MSWTDRIPIYDQIEKHRQRPLIVYVTSKRPGVDAPMATDAVPYLMEQLDRLPKESKAIDLLIASLGGEPMVAWRIMSLLHQRMDKVSVLIPQSAYSAATLVAFGANEIVMHPNGHIGPVDMQIETYGESGAKKFSTEDLTAFVDYIRDNLKITEQEHIRGLFEGTCREVGTLGIGFTARSSKLAVNLAERLLELHMKSEEEKAKIPSIVDNMSRKFHSHGWPVTRKEAIGIGLPANKDRDETLEKLMWEAWLSIEADLKENSPFHPLYEVLNSGEAPKLLKPVAQIDLPMPAEGTNTHFQQSIKDVKDNLSDSVNPVDFEVQLAIVESSKLAHTSMARGKILSCRTPNMVIQWNALTTFRGWKKEETNTKEKGKEE
jgi:Serine dehydrogenase proteinase